MNEFKFRVWDKEKKEFYTNHDIFIRASDGVIYTDDVLSYDTLNYETELADQDRFVLSPYIGLTDKNGVEIYSSDIVKATFELDGSTRIGGIRFSADKLQYVIEIEGGWILYTKKIFESCEVIGNMFENPGIVREAENEIEEV